MYYYQTAIGLESRSVAYVNPDETVLALTQEEYQARLEQLLQAGAEPEVEK